MELIGLTGYARSGKDTAADYMVREHGYVKMSFAAPLKGMLITLNPVVGHTRFLRRPLRVKDLFRLYGSEEGIKASRYGKEYRRLLQVLGTDCIRKHDKDFWVKAAMKQVDCMPKSARVVFTDVRFPNEAAAIRERGFLACVHRPGVHAVNGHSSEQHVGRMGEDFYIDNSGGIVHLGSDVANMLDVIGYGQPK